MIEALLEVRACVRTSQLSDSLRQYLYDKYMQSGHEHRAAPMCRETEGRGQWPALPGAPNALAASKTPDQAAPLRRWASRALGLIVLVGSVAVFLLVAWGGGAA
jgi:ferric-dicitrate binding protein FerR (iron transport regulator)